MSDSNFVWYELITTDDEAATAFYKAVVGWDAVDSGLTDRRYTIFNAGKVGVGGVITLPAEAVRSGARPIWEGYLGVDDVDGYVARVKRAGGTVHRAAEDIPGIGRFAMVADPQGAGFILFTPLPGQQPVHPEPGAPGLTGWHELHAAEWKQAFAFYSDLFGWQKADAVDMGPMGTYQLFTAGGPATGGMMTKTDAIPVPMWLYYFNVEDTTAAAARVTEHGGRVVNGPHQVPGGSWIVQCLDPQGAMFALNGPAN
jgi:uncharacterized protein